MKNAIGSAAASAVLRGEAVQWETLALCPADWLAVCVDQGVAALIHERLERLSGPEGPPQAIREAFAAYARAQFTAELVRQRETVIVLSVLRDAGVRPVLIKGTALAYFCYDAPWLRPRNDTDLVIPRHHVEKARSALQALGYTSINYCDGELLFGQFELARTDGLGLGHAVDVHWKVSTQAVFADVVTYAELASQAEPVPALAPTAPGAGAPDAAGLVHALLLACIHPSMHHHNEQRLIWLHDVHLLAGKLSAATARAFVQLAISRGVAAVCADQLARTRSELGTHISDDVVSTLRRTPGAEPSAAYLRAGRQWRHDLFASLRALPGWRERAQLAREVLLPAPRYMLASYGLGPGTRIAALLPALYVHRLARGIWKVITGRKR